MERRAEIVEEVIISLKLVCNVEKEKKNPSVNTVEYSTNSGESLFTVQLTPEHAIHSNVPSKMTAAMNIKRVS